MLGWRGGTGNDFHNNDGSNQNNDHYSHALQRRSNDRLSNNLNWNDNMNMDDSNENNNSSYGFVQTMSSTTIKDGNGNIWSEKKGMTKDTTGNEKHARQQRMNDKSYTRTRQKNNRDNNWDEREYKYNINNDNELQELHDMFNRTPFLSQTNARQPRRLTNNDKHDSKNDTKKLEYK